MKVLFVTPGYPPYTQGGGEVVYQTLARKLARKGHNITIISSYYGKEPRKERICLTENEGQINVIWFPLMRFLDKRYPQMRSSLPPTVRSLVYLRRINYNQYDVIHLLAFGHLLIDYVAMVAKSPKKILTVHAFPKYVEKNGEANFLLKILYKIYIRILGKHTFDSATKVTTISQFTAEECVKKGVLSNKIKVIPNGINLHDYKPLSYRELAEKFHICNDDILILTIGRIVWYKGLEYALEAIGQVAKTAGRKIKYVVMGSIEDKDYYRMLNKQVGKLGLNEKVVFAGFLSQNLKLQALSRANIFLAPSLHEGFGLTLLEAMALKKPIIASNCEGIKCILEHDKTGILVKPASSEEVADAIRLLLSNPDIQEKLSKNAFSEVQKHSWKNVVERYEGLYERILAGMYEKATRSGLNGI
jgi:glycosyltransferase involved in cell wall biosynthesis